MGNRPSFAELYLLSSEQNSDPVEIRSLVSRLFQGSALNRLYQQISQVSGRSGEEDFSEAELHLLDDPDIFRRALIGFVAGELESGVVARKYAFHEAVWRLAEGPVDEDPRWGEHHAFDEPLRALVAFDIVMHPAIIW
jgi:hypothetical protein